MTLCLEGWPGLQGFGGNLYFLKSARSTMQLKDGEVDNITHDQIDLADVSFETCLFSCPTCPDKCFLPFQATIEYRG
jgi:hypothetical protein